MERILSEYLARLMLRIHESDDHTWNGGSG